mmetsp:Transcript_17974/g.34938  ORF Transcript_17974/g.34938 Transcript_17974/m.34938 type:complete len:339 (-) Transcript_17974:39-1055(-)
MRASTQTAGIICIVLFLLVQYQKVDHVFPSNTISSQTPSKSGNSSSISPPSSSSRQPRLGDGCYHVFLDVGSNIGLHARFLYEPHHYPDSKSSVRAFEEQFGPNRDNRDYCIFAFEPNPTFRKRHLELAEAYDKIGWRYHPILAGAATVDGNMTFYHSFMVDTINRDKELGFSAVTPKTLYGKESKWVTVPTIRLASWIIREIRDRKIPDVTHSGTKIKPKVVMKMDIEGIEYRVFPDLLLTGALCDTIDFLMGEFHYGPGDHNKFPMNLTSDGKHSLKHRKEGQALAKEMFRMVEITENCKTVISLEDDESYGTDPIDFPTLQSASTLGRNDTTDQK